MLRAAIAITLIVLFGRLLLRPFFRLVASTHSTELFVAAGLFVIVAAGLIAHQANLSMALGAFIAGLVLAETEYGKAIETVVEPFKGLLLGELTPLWGETCNRGRLWARRESCELDVRCSRGYHTVKRT